MTVPASAHRKGLEFGREISLGDTPSNVGKNASLYHLGVV